MFFFIYIVFFAFSSYLLYAHDEEIYTYFMARYILGRIQKLSAHQGGDAEGIHCQRYHLNN